MHVVPRHEPRGLIPRGLRVRDAVLIDHEDLVIARAYMEIHVGAMVDRNVGAGGRPKSPSLEVADLLQSLYPVLIICHNFTLLYPPNRWVRHLYQ